MKKFQPYRVLQYAKSGILIPNIDKVPTKQFKRQKQSFSDDLKIAAFKDFAIFKYLQESTCIGVFPSSYSEKMR